MQSFPCSQCGLCCQHVHHAEETRYLDRGDGVCRHFVEISKSCSIYAERPDICRVKKMYDLHFISKYSWGDFIALNLKVCTDLQLLDGLEHKRKMTYQEAAT